MRKFDIFLVVGILFLFFLPNILRLVRFLFGMMLPSRRYVVGAPVYRGGGRCRAPGPAGTRSRFNRGKPGGSPAG